MKKLMIMIGNGITIDLIGRLGLSDRIDTSNLFKNGDSVVWPDGQNEQGFLSYKYCHNLWNLGARSYMDISDASQLIEDIISCINMMPKNMDSVGSKRKDNIYLNAYYELAAYLKHLFILYDGMVREEDMQKREILDWGWYKLIKNAYANPEYSEIIIVTYNYDVFLERLLMAHNIPFDVLPVAEQGNKIKLIKPHGSISFAHNKKNDRISYGIRKDSVMYEADIHDFNVIYEGMDDNFLVSALIPPSGDSSRLTYRWADQLRQEVKAKASSLQEGDKFILSGLSYWHVDRKEIDDVLNSLDSRLQMYMINPRPPRALNAVLSCVFDNYVLYTRADNLGGLI
ncbi:hypothetical protein [Anaerolentibacter hominis]|uniref:hypothetical protein n=1 Tax=Anaerolentibacter hominis TaxID=3079009 RepID=UPI0031B7FF8D